MKIFVNILMMLTAMCFIIAQVQWKVNTSLITFSIKNGGFIVKGSFDGLIADIKFDPANYSKSVIDASVDVNTINTGINMRNNHLKKEEYFDAAKFPRITLKSTSFSKEKDGAFKGHFKLLMKGVTKDIVIPFSCKESKNTAVFNGTFTLKRKDYGIGGNSLTMADDVTVTIIINTTKAQQSIMGIGQINKTNKYDESKYWNNSLPHSVSF